MLKSQSQSKSKYLTRQRKILISYLDNHPDEALTAREIADALKSENISLSAVYRNLSELEEEGKLRRQSSAGNRKIKFQYLDAAACRDKLHLTCTRCGRTFHMNNETARSLIHAAEEADGFEIDKSETVLYGVCDSCRK